MTSILQRGVRIWLAIIARACVLLAFSEYVFFNEGPVEKLLSADGLVPLIVVLLDILAFYLIPAALLLMLEPFMTTRSRIILAGAFVGWSIEAVVVPASYENIPFSYFWTAITWHATIDVALGWYFFQDIILRRNFGKAATGAILFGVAVAIWSTWTWGYLDLTVTSFGLTMLIIVGLLLVGFGIESRLGHPPRMGKLAVGLTIAVNLLLFGAWATAFFLPALGLVLLATFNGYCLWRAPHSPARPRIGEPRTGMLVLLPLAIPAGMLCFAAIAAAGISAAIGDLLVPLVAYGGLGIYGAVVFAALRRKR